MINPAYDYNYLSPLFRGVWGAALVCALLAVGCADAQTEVNQAPVLTLDIGTQAEFVVGDLIQIRANADDADGDPLTFSVEGLPERATLQTFPNSALMNWDPIASDVTTSEGRKLVFVVKDTRGGRAERVVNLRILAGNGTPVFESPSSKLFNARSGQTLVFEIKVRDDDSNEVHLSMPADTAPEGATFEQTDQKVGTFSWAPSDAQLAQRVHSATFVAEDNQGAPVQQKVTFILQSAPGDNPGDDPNPPTPGASCDVEQVITHAAPGAQRTVDDYELEAYLSPAGAQKYDTGFVFWSTVNPMQYEVDMESVEMKVGQGLMRAGIPNLLLAAGESETIYYSICALDSTVDINEEGAFICSPASIYYSFVAYSPDSNFCADDDTSGTTFSSATEVSALYWEDHRTCADAPDFHKVSVSAGELAEVFVAYSLTGSPGSPALTHPMDVAVYDQDMNLIEEAALRTECSGLNYILLEAGASATTWYIKVTPRAGAQMPYQITAFHSEEPDEEDPVEPACEDDDTFGAINRSPEEAALVDDGEYTGLTVCGGESAADWYTNILGVGDSVYVELEVEQGAQLSDIYFAAYTSSGGLKAVGQPEFGSSIIEFEANVEDLYYYIVEAPSETRYTLFFMTY